MVLFDSIIWLYCFDAMMVSNKKVSIIIACYNAENWVVDAIESALSQTYKNTEIICIDDCSTDKTFEIISRYESNPIVHILKNSKNLGVVRSRNLAIKESGGDYILPLDADDKIDPTYIEKAVNILNDSSIGIVYCDVMLFGNKTGKWKLPVFDIKTILFQNCIHSCAMFRRKDFFTVGCYKTYMDKGLEDWDLWLSIISLYKEKNNFGVYKIPEILFYYRKIKEGSRSTSFDDFKINLYSNLIVNHSDLYLSNTEVIKRVFGMTDKITDKKLYRYRKRYQMLFIINIFLCITCFCVLIL